MKYVPNYGSHYIIYGQDNLTNNLNLSASIIHRTLNSKKKLKDVKNFWSMKFKSNLELKSGNQKQRILRTESGISLGQIELKF